MNVNSLEKNSICLQSIVSPVTTLVEDLQALHRRKDLLIRLLEIDEFAQVKRWAENEGWNPGEYETSCLCNRDLFTVKGVFINGTLVASLVLTHHTNYFKFIGCFIVDPSYRGNRIGHILVKNILDILPTDNYLIGINAVHSKVNNYQRLYDFIGTDEVISRWSVNLQKVKNKRPIKTCNLYITQAVEFSQLLSYDAAIFSYCRSALLQEWIRMPESYLLVAIKGDKICGYGLLSKCYNGYKIAPLFADNSEIAASLLREFLFLAAQLGSAELQLDIPEMNEKAKGIVSNLGFIEKFKTTRMYKGSRNKDLTFPINNKEKIINNVFAYTSLEFG